MNLVRPTASGSVLVAGTIALDTIARVDALPGPDEACRADAIADRPGGCGANVAHALARLGHRPALLSAAGRGFDGSRAQRALEASGVDLDHVVRAEAPTARAVVTTEDQGRQTIVYHEGATPAMRDLSPVPASLGHFAPGELTAYPALMDACERVTYDPGQETFHRPIEEVLAPIDHADVLLANEHEARRITDVYGGLDALVDALDAVVVTDPGGQDVHTAQGRERVPGVEAELLDATGAGDAHSAGVVHGIDAGWSLPQACRMGSVLAAFAVEGLGAQAGLPTLEEALERYEAAYGEAPA